MDWDAITVELGKKLDPKNVKKPSGNFGPKGDYIEGFHAINEANRIFGFGGWSYTIDLRQDDVRETQKNGKTQWQAAYTCICTLTVDGVTRQDVGFGSGFAAQIGDAIEGATKESVTDSLKRCLRTFGNPFGLALYDKTRENVGAPAPVEPAQPKVSGPDDHDPDQLTASLVKLYQAAANLPRIKEIRGGERFQAARAWLAKHHPNHAEQVTAAEEAALARVDPAMQRPADEAA